MLPSPTDADFVRIATEVEKSFRLATGLYLVGSLEKGVTVYKQQVRAHNLSWAIQELRSADKFDEFKRVAIVGGGICGLTTAACFLSLFPSVSVTLFEELWDLCPLQQGSDNRWLHPTIYDWPAPGTRAPEAKLPVLNWVEGRASDVARRIISEFVQVNKAFDPENKRLSVYIGLGYLRIHVAKKRVDWIGSKTIRSDSFFVVGAPEGGTADFDLILIAAGFGLEVSPDEYRSASYWRNEQISQPMLDGTRKTFLVSGYGDGALTDLFRLTIERFRQDTILYELFGDRLEDAEKYFRAAFSDDKKRENIFVLFVEAEHQDWLKTAKLNLAARIRKDTRVVLHAKGRGDPTSFDHVYEPHSSFLSRLLTFLLQRCGAFSISLDSLPAAIRDHDVPSTNVICRYGADPIGHVQKIFVDPKSVEVRLKELEKSKPQKPHVAWRPGAFPVAW